MNEDEGRFKAASEITNFDKQPRHNAVQHATSFMSEIP